MAWFDSIEQIFVISLQKRAERRIIITNELKKRNIPFRVWYAVERENGEQGLKETMMALVEHCLAKDYSKVLFLEDDATFIQPDEIIEKAFDQLPEDFHLFYLGCTLMTKPEKISDNILKVWGAYSSHAIVYSKQGLRAALSSLQTKPKLAYDVQLNYYGHQMNRYCSYPMICTQRPGESDIYKHDERNVVLAPFYNSQTKVTDWGSFMEKQYLQLTKDI